MNFKNTDYKNICNSIVSKAKIEIKNWVNPPKCALLNFEIKIFLSYFSFVLALKTKDAQMFFWSVFLLTSFQKYRTK